MSRDRVAVAEFDLLPEAEMARSFLAGEGIEAGVENAHMDNLGKARASIRLLVDGHDAARAAELLGARATHLRARIERGDIPRCPDCESDDLHLVRRPPDTLLARLWYGLRHDLGVARLSCRTCSYEWSEPW